MAGDGWKTSRRSGGLNLVFRTMLLPMPHALFRPSGPLAATVACLWFWEGAPTGHAKEQLMPNGEVAIVFNLREEPIRIYQADDSARFQSFGSAVLSGPRTTPFVIDAVQQERVFGIQFQPGGAFPFFRPPISELAGASLPLEELWQQGAAELREQLLEARSPAEMSAVAERHLLTESARSTPVHPAVRVSLRELGRPKTPRVASIVDRLGLSQRRFSELFRAQVGLSPKAFSRVRRFQRVLRRVHGQRQVNWTEIALDCGYYDQPHFNHDFQEFSGLTPGTYHLRKSEHLNHVPLA